MAAAPPSSPVSPADVLAEILGMEGSLAVRLEAYADMLRAQQSPFADAYQRLVQRLREGEAGAGAPEVGEAMPPFLLPDRAGRMVGLDQLLAAGPLVLSFNRGPWCPFCRIELAALGDAAPGLAAFGARVVSIMPARASFTAAMSAELGERIILLTDLDNDYALSLGIAMWVGDEVRELMRERELALDLINGNESWFLPLPATFVVGRDGRIRARFIDPDFRDRMPIEEIVAALEAEAASTVS